MRVVSAYPIPPIEKVEGVYPPEGLVRLIGGVTPRLLTFLKVGLRCCPHVAMKSISFLDVMPIPFGYEVQWPWKNGTGLI